eukprot:jgi/Psemu1/287777/fgenesh1_pg.213_\
MLISIGQANHTVTSYMTIWASGYRVKSIKPIEAEKALKDGAEFVGEGFVLAVTAATVIFEYNRSSNSAARKAEEKRERIRADQKKLNAKLNALDIRLKAIEDLIRQQQEIEDKKSILTRVVPVVGPEKAKYVEPPKEQLVPIAENDEDDDTPAATTNDATKEEKLSENTGRNTTIEPLTTASEIDSEQQPSPQSWWKFW